MVTPITTTILLIAIVLFNLGLIVGWVLSNHVDITTEAGLKTLVAIVITVGWFSATVATIFVASYTMSPLLHALMGAIVGYFFTEDGINLNIGNKK